jgi:KDO2-lipid IV(A) lauroyltransferase
MRFVSVLKRGEALAVLIDQHGGTRGLPTEFFGTETPTHTVAARLHRLTGSPICFGYCIRTGLMRFKLTMPKPIVRAPTDNKAEDVRAIIEMLNRELEQAIRQHPDQYLWAHRRWR